MGRRRFIYYRSAGGRLEVRSIVYGRSTTGEVSVAYKPSPLMCMPSCPIWDEKVKCAGLDVGIRSPGTLVATFCFPAERGLEPP